MRLVAGGHRTRWRSFHQSHWRGMALVGMTVTGLLLAAGCSSSQTPASASLTTITVDAAPGVADAPLFLGIRDGLFRNAGLRIVVKEVTAGNQPIPASEDVSDLEHQKADIAFSDYADMFYAAEQPSGGSLQVAADGYDCGQNVMEVLTYPGSRITSPQRLQGETVVTPASQGMPTTNAAGQPVPFSLETLVTWSALQANDVSPAQQVGRHITWLQEPSATMLADLGPGTAPGRAMIATEPNIYEAEWFQGAVPVLDVCSGATADLPLYGYFTTSTFAASDPTAYAGFRSALETAQADAAASPGAINSVLQNVANLDSLTSALVTTGSYPTSTAATDLQRVADLMIRFDALPRSLNVSAIIAN